MRQVCDRKVEDVRLKRDGPQVSLDSTASQIFAVCYSLTPARARRRQHPGHSTTSHLSLEYMLLSLVSRSVDEVTRLVSVEDAAQQTRLKDAVT